MVTSLTTPSGSPGRSYGDAVLSSPASPAHPKITLSLGGDRGLPVSPSAGPINHNDESMTLVHRACRPAIELNHRLRLWGERSSIMLPCAESETKLRTYSRCEFNITLERCCAQQTGIHAQVVEAPLIAIFLSEGRAKDRTGGF